MHRTPSQLCFVFAALMVSAPAASQATATPAANDVAGSSRVTASVPTGDARVPIHTAAADRGHEYGIWGAGDSYKASFHDGMTFVPYLGRAATARHLGWRTTSVRIGEAELRTHEPRFDHTDYRAEFDLGDVVEAYDLRTTGLEQTFVVERRPTTPGDLVIRGAIATDLHAEARPAAPAAIDFVDAEGNAVIRYGAATAIDATGREQPMSSAWANGVMTLRLDAQWLDAASYPVTVDPLIGNLLFTSGSAIVEDVDLLHDANDSTYPVWVADIRWASANDGDLRVIRNPGMAAITVPMVYSDITSTWSTEDCSIGLHRHEGRTVTAFSRLFSNNTRGLRFHVHARSDTTLSTTYRAVQHGGHAWRPDVSSDLGFLTPDTLAIVYQQENGATFFPTTASEVHGVLIDVGTETAGNTFLIGGGPLLDHENPAINQSTEFANGEWTVACQVRGLGHATNNLLLWRLDRTATPMGPTTIDVSPGWHELAPAIGGYNTDIAVAQPRVRASTVGATYLGEAGDEIIVRRYAWNGASFDVVHFGWRYGVGGGLTQRDARIDLDETTRSHYVLAYRGAAAVWMRSIGYACGPLFSEGLHIHGAGESTVLGNVAYDKTHERFLFGYGLNNPATNPSSHRVYVAAYEHPSAPPPAYSGIGCSSAQLDWLGSQLIGDEDCRLRLTGLPAGALATAFVGFAPVNQLLIGVPPVQSGCWLLVPNIGAGHLATMPVGFGPTITYDIDLPESLLPFTMYFQGIHFDAAGVEVLTTNRMAVDLVK